MRHALCCIIYYCVNFKRPLGILLSYLHLSYPGEKSHLGSCTSTRNTFPLDMYQLLISPTVCMEWRIVVSVKILESWGNSRLADIISESRIGMFINDKRAKRNINFTADSLCRWSIDTDRVTARLRKSRGEYWKFSTSCETTDVSVVYVIVRFKVGKRKTHREIIPRHNWEIFATVHRQWVTVLYRSLKQYPTFKRRKKCGN